MTAFQTILKSRERCRVAWDLRNIGRLKLWEVARHMGVSTSRAAQLVNRHARNMQLDPFRICEDLMFIEFALRNQMFVDSHI